MQEFQTKNYYNRKNGLIGVIGGFFDFIVCIGASFWVLSKISESFPFLDSMEGIAQWVFFIFFVALLLLISAYFPYRWLTFKSRFKKYSNSKQFLVYCLIIFVPILVIILTFYFVMLNFLGHSLNERMQNIFIAVVIFLTVFTYLSMLLVLFWYPFISCTPVVTLNQRMVTFKWRPLFLRLEIPLHTIEYAALMNEDKYLLVVYKEEGAINVCKFPLKVLRKADRAKFVQCFFQYKG